MYCLVLFAERLVHCSSNSLPKDDALLQIKQKRVTELGMQVPASTTGRDAAMEQLKEQLMDLEGVINDKDILITFLDQREAHLDMELTELTRRFKRQLLHAWSADTSQAILRKQIMVRLLLEQLSLS